jgi:hypothetical protein
LNFLLQDHHLLLQLLDLVGLDHTTLLPFVGILPQLLSLVIQLELRPPQLLLQACHLLLQLEIRMP